jgi:phosphoribosyl 1,2-cyclic phosphate phosphodiesterase
MRASLYIEGAGGERALIDAGPEFRLQALRAGIAGLDGVFLTHAHADHLHGLDDLRPLSRDKPIRVYGNEQTIAEMRERFSYVFGESAQQGGGKPRLIPQTALEPVRIRGLVFTPVPVKHGILDILGWELRENPPEAGGGLLYLTDTSAVPSASWSRLGGKGFHIIIIGALRIRPHQTHFNFEEALNTALSLGAKKICLTHICHDHSHREIEEFCRNFATHQGIGGTEIHPAWDGMELTLKKH